VKTLLIALAALLAVLHPLGAVAVLTVASAALITFCCVIARRSRFHSCPYPRSTA
jgi:hypothetical protein